MSDSQAIAMHTPGPWILGETSHDIIAPRGVPVASPCDGYDEEQWLVDGRLIAAAPDLLAACHAFCSTLAFTPSSIPGAIEADLRTAYDLARAAIAKTEPQR